MVSDIYIILDVCVTTFLLFDKLLKVVIFLHLISYILRTIITLLIFFSPFPAAFIRVVGSEFVQKYLGEGPRMVRDVFRLAKENAPAIIFIDEIDAIATKRFDAQTGGMIRDVSQQV